jgi:hypothetical protein
MFTHILFADLAVKAGHNVARVVFEGGILSAMCLSQPELQRPDFYLSITGPQGQLEFNIECLPDSPPSATLFLVGGLLDLVASETNADPGDFLIGNRLVVVTLDDPLFTNYLTNASCAAAGAAALANNSRAVALCTAGWRRAGPIIFTDQLLQLVPAVRLQDCQRFHGGSAKWHAARRAR